jgi:carbon storage regulator
MLVLSRRQGEQILIGSGIKVTVLAIHKGTVRLGLAAPREVPIHREEVRRRIDGGTTKSEVEGKRPPTEGQNASAVNGQYQNGGQKDDSGESRRGWS